MTCVVGERGADESGWTVEVEELIVVIDEITVVTEDCTEPAVVAAVRSVDSFGDGALIPIVVTGNGVTGEVLAFHAMPCANCQLCFAHTLKDQNILLRRAIDRIRVSIDTVIHVFLRIGTFCDPVATRNKIIVGRIWIKAE